MYVAINGEEIAGCALVMSDSRAELSTWISLHMGNGVGRAYS
jgi:hypothetical protein